LLCDLAGFLFQRLPRFSRLGRDIGPHSGNLSLGLGPRRRHQLAALFERRFALALELAIAFGARPAYGLFVIVEA
jgi:hypothetical protein